MTSVKRSTPMKKLEAFSVESLPIRRLQLSAGLIGLIGLTGLLLLLAQDSRAEGLGNRPNFPGAGGVKNFNSPFPATPQGKQYFDEGDEEDSDFAEDAPPPRQQQAQTGANAGGDQGSVSLGGSENSSGVVSNNKKPA